MNKDYPKVVYNRNPKRFNWIEQERHVGGNPIYDDLNKKQLTPFECYRLLNGLNDMNEQLIKENKELRGEIDAILGMIRLGVDKDALKSIEKGDDE